MTFDEYQTLALRTAKQFESLPANLIHAALGIATEGGEFTTAVKRIAIYQKPVDPALHLNMLEELGDLMWYIALACHHLGVTLENVCSQNVAKLQARFPDKYSDGAAEARADKGGLPPTES